jgi:ABC-2 type transport system permease protein
MRQVFVLAMKDLKVMVRVKPALFFAVGWPLCMAILFGLMFGGSGERRKLPIALVDEDRTPASAQILTQLGAREGLDALQTDRAQATDLVRHGSRSVAVVVPAGFGAAQGHPFQGASPRLDLLVDPSHVGEGFMLQGFLFDQAGQRLFTWMRQTGMIAANDWKPLTVTTREITAEHLGPRNGFEVSFVQGLVWGLIGCAMTFAISLVTERTRGTLVRLRVAPLTAGQVLGGKALACFLALLLMQSLLLGLGTLVFKIQVAAPLFLIAMMICASLAFVGITMLVASFGRNEQATSGAGWALLMPMSLFGGGMVPLFVMPAWMAPISNFSPIKWVVFGLEGAIWRGFTPVDFLLPCGILLAVGATGFLLGATHLRRATL